MNTFTTQLKLLEKLQLRTSAAISKADKHPMVLPSGIETQYVTRRAMSLTIAITKARRNLLDVRDRTPNGRVIGPTSYLRTCKALATLNTTASKILPLLEEIK